MAPPGKAKALKKQPMSTPPKGTRKKLKPHRPAAGKTLQADAPPSIEGVSDEHNAHRDDGTPATVRPEGLQAIPLVYLQPHNLLHHHENQERTTTAAHARQVALFQLPQEGQQEPQVFQPIGPSSNNLQVSQLISSLNQVPSAPSIFLEPVQPQTVSPVLKEVVLPVTVPEVESTTPAKLQAWRQARQEKEQRRLHHLHHHHHHCGDESCEHEHSAPSSSTHSQSAHQRRGGTLQEKWDALIDHGEQPQHTSTPAKTAKAFLLQDWHKAFFQQSTVFPQGSPQQQQHETCKDGAQMAPFRQGLDVPVVGDVDPAAAPSLASRQAHQDKEHIPSLAAYTADSEASQPSNPQYAADKAGAVQDPQRNILHLAENILRSAKGITDVVPPPPQQQQQQQQQHLNASFDALSIYTPEGEDPQSFLARLIPGTTPAAAGASRGIDTEDGSGSEAGSLPKRVLVGFGKAVAEEGEEGECHTEDSGGAGDDEEGKRKKGKKKNRKKKKKKKKGKSKNVDTVLDSAPPVAAPAKSDTTDVLSFRTSDSPSEENRSASGSLVTAGMPDAGEDDTTFLQPHTPIQTLVEADPGEADDAVPAGVPVTIELRLITSSPAPLTIVTDHQELQQRIAGLLAAPGADEEYEGGTGTPLPLASTPRSFFTSREVTSPVPSSWSQVSAKGDDIEGEPLPCEVLSSGGLVAPTVQRSGSTAGLTDGAPSRRALKHGKKWKKKWKKSSSRAASEPATKSIVSGVEHARKTASTKASNSKKSATASVSQHGSHGKPVLSQSSGYSTEYEGPTLDDQLARFALKTGSSSSASVWPFLSSSLSGAGDGLRLAVISQDDANEATEVGKALSPRLSSHAHKSARETLQEERMERTRSWRETVEIDALPLDESEQHLEDDGVYDDTVTMDTAAKFSPGSSSHGSPSSSSSPSSPPSPFIFPSFPCAELIVSASSDSADQICSDPSSQPLSGDSELQRQQSQTASWRGRTTSSPAYQPLSISDVERSAMEIFFHHSDATWRAQMGERPNYTTEINDLRKTILARHSSTHTTNTRSPSPHLSASPVPDESPTEFSNLQFEHPQSDGGIYPRNVLWEPLHPRTAQGQHASNFQYRSQHQHQRFLQRREAEEEYHPSPYATNQHFLEQHQTWHRHRTPSQSTYSDPVSPPQTSFQVPHPSYRHPHAHQVFHHPYYAAHGYQMNEHL